MPNGNPYRRFCRICWFGGRCWRIAISGSFAHAANWSGIVGVGLVAFLLHLYGRKIMPAQVWPEIVAQGLVYIAVAWIIIFLVRLMVWAPFIVHRDGHWYGNKFVYLEPKLALREYISPSDNNKLFKFAFPDAPPFAFINYKIKLDGRSNLISLFVRSQPDQCPDLGSANDHQYTGGGIAVNRKREIYLKTFMRHDASPFSVRIYVLSWEDTSRSNAIHRDREDKDFEIARIG